jgi:two-component system, OmpR family, sensor histidine kinase PrrB
MKRTRSLRKRLALMYLLVFGIIQVLVGATIIVLREITIYTDFDRYLLERAAMMSDMIKLGSDRDPRDPEETVRMLSGQPRWGFWELRRASGEIVQRAGNLGTAELPAPPPYAGGGRKPEFLTVKDGSAAKMIGTLRMVRVYADPPGTAPYILQVGRETAQMKLNIARMRQVMIIVIPLGLVISAVASGFLARRSLEPIGRAAREAESISAADLSRRLPVPPGGDELTELVHVLNGMLGRLEQGFEAQSRFIANVSHELKTPLIALSSEAQNLSRPGTAQEQRTGFLERVHADCTRLAGMVESFLMLARAESGTPLARTEPVALSETITDAVAHCTAQAIARKVRIRVNLPDDGAEHLVNGDRDLLCSVVENLMRNALRHTPEQSLVTVSLRASGESAEITVHDQGAGIPAEHLEAVFTRFRVLTDPGRAGNGLGLAIAKAVARLHGGDVAGRHPPKGGFEMVVTLPRATEDRAFAVQRPLAAELSRSR